MTMFEEYSRYYSSEVTVITTELGEAKPLVNSYLRPNYESDTYRFYYWSVNDRIDWMSQKKYGDPRLWWVIADANPTIRDWARVPVGSILKVPDYVPTR